MGKTTESSKVPMTGALRAIKDKSAGLRALLPVSLKRVIWNFRYYNKRYPQLTASEDVMATLLGRTDLDSILELGCGRGSMLRGLRSTYWNGYYVGVDISEGAITDARAMGYANSDWIASDIESFEIKGLYSAILMVESIYYLPIPRIAEVLQRALNATTENGFVLIRIHDLLKHREYVNKIRELYPRSVVIGSTLWRIDKGR
jgi:SAM-dependent methyltransferase